MATQTQFNRKVAVALTLGAVALPLLILGSSWLLSALFGLIGLVLVGELLYFTVRGARSISSLALCVMLGCLVLAGAWGMQVAVRAPHHNWLMLTVVLVIVGTDTAAQIAGMRYGTPGTFMPKISPNKSSVGVIAGVVTGAMISIGAIIVWQLLGVPFTPAVKAALLLAPALSVAGDLLESATKRSLGIKDFGRTLGPETGGFMDRFDSWLPTFFVLGLALVLS